MQAETAREIHVHGIKEITSITTNGKFRFPLAEDLIRQLDPGARRVRNRTRRLSWEADDAPEAGGDSDATLDADEKEEKAETYQKE